MMKTLRLLLLATLVAGLFGLGPIGTGTVSADSNGLRLVINPPNGSGILSGYIQGIDGSIEFVSVTVTFSDGTSRTVNVDSSTGWQFSFGVVPDDGFVSLALTENPIPMPQMYGNQWD